MPEEITRESDNSVRIVDTGGRIVSLRELRNELASVNSLIDEATRNFNKSIETISMQKVAIEGRIARAIALGVQDDATPRALKK